MNGMDSGKELKDSSNSPGVMDLSLRPLQVCWRKKKRVAEEFVWKILEACVGGVWFVRRNQGGNATWRC